MHIIIYKCCKAHRAHAAKSMCCNMHVLQSAHVPRLMKFYEITDSYQMASLENQAGEGNPTQKFKKKKMCLKMIIRLNPVF